MASPTCDLCGAQDDVQVCFLFLWPSPSSLEHLYPDGSSPACHHHVQSFDMLAFMKRGNDTLYKCKPALDMAIKERPNSQR
eukprot:1147055-Pelagomonas_calceolata.AAC.1